MAIGDDAAAAGMALVDGATTDANTIDTELNRTRDYIALGKLKDGALAPAKIAGTVPISKGGTGQATVAAARNAFGLGNTGGPVPIANGGTGGTTVVEAAGYLKVVPWTAVAPPGNAYSNMLARYSGQGRLQAVGPAVNDDVATKYYVDVTTTTAIAELLDAIVALTARVAALEATAR